MSFLYVSLRSGKEKEVSPSSDGRFDQSTIITMNNNNGNSAKSKTITQTHSRKQTHIAYETYEATESESFESFRVFL